MTKLGEEGAIQVFSTVSGNTLLLGDVGPLQFEIVAQRLATEYKVDAIYDAANLLTARSDLTFPDETLRRSFEREQAAAWRPTSTATRCFSRRTGTTCK